MQAHTNNNDNQNEGDDMGNKYTVEAWGRHGGEHEPYSMAVVWQGESLIVALYSLWISRRAGYGCVTLSVRGMR